MSSSTICCRTACNLSPSSSTSLHRVSAINRIEKRRVIQSRSLWWWGRHGSWSSANEHDNVEERLRRQQKIMSYRYSRALRRRATWDRDNSPPTWLWRGPDRALGRRWGCKPVSTSEHMQAKLKEEESGIPRQDKPWEDFHRDFESFKAAVDKAIERDPTGYLFGRRLRSPTADNSGSLWNIFPSIFNHQEIKRDDAVEKKPVTSATKIKIEALDNSKNTHKSDRHGDVPVRPTTWEIYDDKSRPADEYIYDPISGRKVLKTQTESTNPSQPRKPFLQALFGEHTPEKVDPTPKPTITGSKGGEKLDKKPFENSRTREYLQLRAATLGTSIDTTAAFGGKYQSEVEVEAANESRNKRIKTSPEHDEVVPPFSGTIYAKAGMPDKSIQPGSPRIKSTWLQQEGFGQPTQRTPSSTASENTRSNKLQPAFDRMGTNHDRQPETKYITKLQPALDRMESSKPPRETKTPRPAPLDVTSGSSVQKKQSSTLLDDIEHSPKPDTREDLDLLRASDIRAATKTARVTKQEVDQAKSEARSKLEADYVNRQKAAETSSDMDSARMAVRSAKSAASINSVVKHMQRYPDGIVAKTMKSMGVYNENFKKYQKPTGGHVDLTEKLDFKPEALEKLPSIYKAVQNKLRANVTAESSAEVVRAEKVQAEALESVRAAKQEQLLQEKKETTQIKDLAYTINDIYQTHTDLAKPTQANEAFVTDTTVEERKDMVVRPAHPLQTATVKLGVRRYPEIEYHVQVFEPKLIEAREKLKAVTKNTTEMRAAVAIIADQGRSSVVDKQVDAVSKVQEEQCLSSSTQSIGSSTSSRSPRTILAITEDQPQPFAARNLDETLKIEKHPAENNVRRTVPRTASNTTSSAPAVPINSPYVLLTYNANSKEVDVTQLTNLMGAWVDNGKVNPISVMSELNHAAAFVMRFAELERTGYTMLGGGGDVLIFRKQDAPKPIQKDNTEALESIKSIKSVISEIRNRIAIEEAQSQPVFSPSPPTHIPKQSATVLDEIPTSIPSPSPPPPNPSPSPSPTPTSTSTSTSTSPPKSKKKSKDIHKVKRQEEVFSGTLRPNTSSRPGQISDSGSTPASDRPSFLSRLYRATRRVILTVGALGGVAYAIGVVSEGLGAHAQHHRAITDASTSEGLGPRKKVVVTTSTRPGFFSTESTRD